MDVSEKWGTDVDTAVDLALAELKCTREEVEITVLEQPSRGFFGIGSKLALVRVEKKKPVQAPVVEEVKVKEEIPAEKSVFYKGKFTIDEAKDTFLKTDSFTKGFVTVNGFNLGRYWEIGPQQTLYLPSSLLNEGENEIVVFESDGLKGKPEFELVDKPILG